MEILYEIENLEIPPKGEIKILSTFAPQKYATIKCPSSWIKTKNVITKKEKKEAVKTANNPIK